MVSFQCETCNDTLKKPKLDQHAQRCWAVYTCIDCNVTFQGTDYRSHTSCISEDQKYQKSVYKAPKGKGQKGQQQQQQQQATPAPSPAPAPIAAAPEPAPVAGARSGIHPSRLHQVPATPVQQKRAREEPVAAVTEVKEKESTEEPSKKKKKKSKKSKGEKTEGETAVEETKAAEPTPEGTVASFLATLLPTLLTSSQSLVSLRSQVVEKAKAAGWKDAKAVEKVFEEGLWLGGDKPKRMLALKYEA
ncbi:hypothetical protein BCR35DRAFT_305192 [Leucosporidium creatinivorum]|uniref:Zinc finger C2H2 LYAR-type domain-containing protein n=1 Tax=Leucosporidium creatinivorum TaxID=106004 RepID=A0A1Y2F2G4_9BASI|nr:hypothetical protein BCR35DRAFT_305192 [Leucosporidium creatinivorum]